MAKGVKTGGRKAGTPNKSTAERKARVEAAAAEGVTPIEFLLGVMRDEERPMASRIDAAKCVAPYLHPRLATTEFKAPGLDQIGDAMVALIARAQSQNTGVASLLKGD